MSVDSAQRKRMRIALDEAPLVRTSMKPNASPKGKKSSAPVPKPSEASEAVTVLAAKDQQAYPPFEFITRGPKTSKVGNSKVGKVSEAATVLAAEEQVTIVSVDHQINKGEQTPFELVKGKTKSPKTVVNTQAPVPMMTEASTKEQVFELVKGKTKSPKTVGNAKAPVPMPTEASIKEQVFIEFVDLHINKVNTVAVKRELVAFGTLSTVISGNFLRVRSSDAEQKARLMALTKLGPYVVHVSEPRKLVREREGNTRKFVRKVVVGVPDAISDLEIREELAASTPVVAARRILKKLNGVLVKTTAVTVDFPIGKEVPSRVTIGFARYRVRDYVAPPDEPNALLTPMLKIMLGIMEYIDRPKLPKHKRKPRSPGVTRMAFLMGASKVLGLKTHELINLLNTHKGAPTPRTATVTTDNGC